MLKFPLPRLPLRPWLKGFPQECFLVKTTSLGFFVLSRLTVGSVLDFSQSKALTQPLFS